MISAPDLQKAVTKILLNQQWNRSLKLLSNRTEIVYSTAIAHKLAAERQSPVTQVVSQLIATLQTGSSFFNLECLTIPLLCEIWDAVQIHAAQGGLIQFRVGDRALALWLAHLVAFPPRLFPDFAAPSLPASTTFALQHAHARCCSWLQLLHREGLICLVGDDRLPTDWQLSAPVDWLTLDQVLRLDHPLERHLLQQLVLAMEAIAPSEATAKATLAAALAVSQAFQALHRACPMLSDRNSTNKIAAQAGLLLATQRVLSLLLEDGLVIAAPQTL